MSRDTFEGWCDRAVWRQLRRFLLEDRVHLGVEPGDDRPRRAGGNEHAVPRERLIEGAAVAAAGISSNSDAVKDKTTQAMYTDNSGHATFTLQIGPKSDLGIYDTQFEIRKDSYQSSFQQTNLRVV